MSMVSINNAVSSDPRSRLAIRLANLSAVVRWKGSNLVSKTRSNLSVDLGYHVVNPVYLSSQIAEFAETEKHAKLRKQTIARHEMFINRSISDRAWSTLRLKVREVIDMVRQSDEQVEKQLAPHFHLHLHRS